MQVRKQQLELDTAKYIMRNTGLEEAQSGIKIAGRNVNNLRYADETLMLGKIEGRERRG